MTLPRWLSPGAIAFVVVWVLLLAAGRSAFFKDPGTFWHTTTGELVLKDGFIRTDPYTFTFAGTWWVPYQWLGEVGMALAHRVGNADSSDRALASRHDDRAGGRNQPGSVKAHAELTALSSPATETA